MCARWALPSSIYAFFVFGLIASDGTVYWDIQYTCAYMDVYTNYMYLFESVHTIKTETFASERWQYTAKFAKLFTCESYWL